MTGDFPYLSVADPVGATLLAGLRPQRPRTLSEFAEQEIVLPSGPREGLHLDLGFPPWLRLLFGVFDADEYRRYWISGPVQDGKTLCGFTIPMLHMLFELKEDVILGAPTASLVKSRWKQEVLPVLAHSRYAELMPKRGTGSQGGVAEAIRFENGVWLRFMGASGGDEQVSSFTARCVFLTEIDKMDRPGEVSRETDPVRQLEARTTSFDERARTFGECTKSIPEGRIHVEISAGTDHRVFLPCPHCGEYICPDKRDQLVGWREAASAREAKELARYACEHCGGQWTEGDRREAMQHPVLAARTQHVERDGTVTGELPDTDCFGFSWPRTCSAMTGIPRIAEAEWRAAQSETPDAEKEVLQFYWTEPYAEDTLDLSGITRDIVLTHIGRLPQGVCPPETQRLVVAIDIGLHKHWWVAMTVDAERALRVIDYGSIVVGHDPTQPATDEERRPTPAARLGVLAALRQFRSDTLANGWLAGEGADAAGVPKLKAPDLVIVDHSYLPDVVARFCLEGGPEYFAAEGLGSGRLMNAWPKDGPAKQPGRQIGRSGHWWVQKHRSAVGVIRLLHPQADWYKRCVHQGFTASHGAAGAITLFRDTPAGHRDFATQIAAEREKELYIPSRATTAGGKVRLWQVTSSRNHFLDACYNAVCGLDMLGYPPVALESEPSEGEPEAPASEVPAAYQAAEEKKPTPASAPTPVPQRTGSQDAYAPADSKSSWKIGR